jgi:hypothetical protein
VGKSLPQEVLKMWAQLRDQGLSAQMIANAYGVTRNSVIGALWRYDRKMNGPTKSRSNSLHMEKIMDAGISFDTAQAALIDFYNKRGHAATIGLLKNYNASKLSELKKEQYRAFIEDCYR